MEVSDTFNSNRLKNLTKNKDFSIFCSENGTKSKIHVKGRGFKGTVWLLNYYHIDGRISGSVVKIIDYIVQAHPVAQGLKIPTSEIRFQFS